MTQETSAELRTDPVLVEKIIKTPQPLNKYIKFGRKIPTDISLKYDGRIRRVYRMAYEGYTAHWVNVDKKIVLLDATTERKLRRVTSG